MELKQLYVPLSENQKLKYEAQKSNKERFAEPVVQEDVKQSEEVVKEEASDSTDALSDDANDEQANISEEGVAAVETSEVASTEDTLVSGENEILDQVHEMDIDVNDIHVKDFSINSTYDTMNIQKELAKSMSTLFDNTIEVFKPVKPTPVEETPEDDQIEGQMSLEEVLAMFESGEILTRDENVEETSEEVLEEPGEIEELSSIIAEQGKQDIQEEIEEEINNSLAEEQESFMYNLKEDSEEENLEDMDTEDDVQLEEDIEEEIEEIFKSEEVEENQEESEVEEVEEVQEEAETEEVEEVQEEAETEEAEEVQEEAETEEAEEVQDASEIKEDGEATQEVKEASKTEEAPSMNPVKQSEIAKLELKKFISKFTGIKGLDKQILKVLQNVLKVDTQPVKFVFVKGEVRSGKTTLAIEVIKVINRIIQRKNQKIAKIKGINLNDKSIDSLLETLKGSDVLIERVSDMDIEVFIEFVQKLREEGNPRVVIFEDEKTLAEAYLEELPEEYSSFTNVIDIKLKEIRDWASIAENYAKERGYTIDAMGTLALSAKIDQLKAVTTVINNSHIEQLIDEAIRDAEKFSVKRMFAKLFGKTEELTMLTEKNFTK